MVYLSDSPWVALVDPVVLQLLNGFEPTIADGVEIDPICVLGVKVFHAPQLGAAHGSPSGEEEQEHGSPWAGYSGW